jgi:hypothetical protein
MRAAGIETAKARDEAKGAVLEADDLVRPSVGQSSARHLHP